VGGLVHFSQKFGSDTRQFFFPRNPASLQNIKHATFLGISLPCFLKGNTGRLAITVVLETSTSYKSGE